MTIRLPRPATQQAWAMGITGASSIAWLPVIGAPYLRFALTLMAGAAWLVVWADGSLEKLDRQRRALFIGLGLAVLAVIVASVFSRFPGLALTYGGSTGVSAPYWIALLVIMGMSSRITLSKATLNALRWQFAWAVPVAVVGMIESLVSGRVTFGFSNADLFGPMMLLFAPLALGLAVVSRERAALWRIAAAVFVLAVISARTLSGLIGLSAMTFFLVWFAPGLLGLRGRVRTWILGGLSAAALVFLVFGLAYTADVLPAPVEEWATRSLLGRSATTRVEMWNAAVREIRGDLWTGVGPDEYAFEGQQYFSHDLHMLEHYPNPDNELPMDPHSLIVLLPVDFGILGAAAALVIAIAWARGVLKPPHRSREGHLLRWSFALGALGFGYATLFTPFPLLFGGMPLMLAGLALVRPPVPRPWPEPSAWARPRFAVAALAVGLAIAIGGTAVVGWTLFRTSAPEPGRSEGLSWAVRVQPQVAFYRFALLWQQGRFLARSSDPDALVKYQHAVDGSPGGVRYFAPYLVELVRLSLDDAERTGRTDCSWERARLKDALEMSPSLPEAEVEYIHLELAMGHIEHARQKLDAAAEWRGIVPEYLQYEAAVIAAEQ